MTVVTIKSQSDHDPFNDLGSNTLVNMIVMVKVLVKYRGTDTENEFDNMNSSRNS